MTTRLVSALLCGGLMAFMATAAVSAEERKPPPGIDITAADKTNKTKKVGRMGRNPATGDPGRQFFPEDNKSQKGEKVPVKPGNKRIFDRWGNQIQ